VKFEVLTMKTNVANITFGTLLFMKCLRLIILIQYIKDESRHERYKKMMKCYIMLIQVSYGKYQHASRYGYCDRAYATSMMSKSLA
jgi:hypothetical protein